LIHEFYDLTCWHFCGEINSKKIGQYKKSLSKHFSLFGNFLKTFSQKKITYKKMLIEFIVNGKIFDIKIIFSRTSDAIIKVFINSKTSECDSGSCGGM
jgi:myo-inositol-hexaphosphate 3-phosphohydrolase